MAIPRAYTPTPFDRALAAQFEAERTARGWSIAYTIERAGLSRSTWERFIAAERSPRLEQLFALAEAFGMPPSELLRRAESREQAGEKL